MNRGCTSDTNGCTSCDSLNTLSTSTPVNAMIKCCCATRDCNTPNWPQLPTTTVMKTTTITTTLRPRTTTTTTEYFQYLKHYKIFVYFNYIFLRLFSENATSPAEPGSSSKWPSGQAGSKSAKKDNTVLILAIVITLAVLLLLGVAGVIG